VTSFSYRPYVAGDLPALYRFASECVALSGPGRSTWNPGDFAWQLGMFPTNFDISEVVALWEDAQGIAAVAIFEPPLNFAFDLHPRLRSETPLASEVFSWAERKRAGLLGREGPVPAAYQMLEERTLSVEARDTDEQRMAFLRERGYNQADRFSVHLVRDLAAPIEAPVLSAGLRLRHSSDADIEARAELHRDAWSVWGVSTFSASRYGRLREQPVYDETLDVLVEDGDGSLLSSAIAWYDPATKVGHFEPVGTRPSAAGRGLGRAVVMEGLRRLRERGATTALIGTASVNAPAIRCYESCGFELLERAHLYSKRVG
jgi:ribosomal protein S18 acetylase RimI-like enzyme